jgi:hypothetical protein
MSHDKESFVTYNKWEKGQLVSLGDNTTHQIVGQGDVYIKLNNNQIKEMEKLLHVSGLWKNLFLAKQLDQPRGKINIKFGKCTLKNSKRIEIAQCILKASLYKLGVIKYQKINEITIPVIVYMNKQIYGI